MGSALRTIKQKIRRFKTNAARSLLLSYVLKEDEAFLEKARLPATPAQGNGAAPAAGGVAPHPPQASGRPLIVNENGAITDRETLRLTLCALFQTPALTPLQEEIYQYVAGNVRYWADHDLLIGGVRDYLNRRLQSCSAADGEALAGCLQRVYAHIETTRANRLAYSGKDKPNPLAPFWPNPTYEKTPRSIFDEMPFAREHKILDKTTPIGSAGSCFAMEIAHRLQADGYHYVVTEPDVQAQDGSPYSRACARWGTIFNTPSFRQLVERSFGVRTLPRILWSMREDGKNVFLDPYRESVPFDSVEEYEANQEAHLAAAREALLRVKVFVITLGMNEVWRLKSDGSVFSRTPWRIAANLVERKVLGIEENLAELQAMLDLWRTYNPALKLIVSTSPVPLDATFRGEEAHVITANCYSKSVLRVAAEEFAARNEGVYYFPSYEVVMYCMQDAWQPDQRHVSREAVDKVMRLFDRIFVADAALESGKES